MKKIFLSLLYLTFIAISSTYGQCSQADEIKGSWKFLDVKNPVTRLIFLDLKNDGKVIIHTLDTLFKDDTPSDLNWKLSASCDSFILFNDNQSQFEKFKYQIKNEMLVLKRINEYMPSSDSITFYRSTMKPASWDEYLQNMKKYYPEVANLYSASLENQRREYLEALAQEADTTSYAVEEAAVVEAPVEVSEGEVAKSVPAETVPYEYSAPITANQIEYHIIGTEPFWSLDIHDGKAVFKSATDGEMTLEVIDKTFNPCCGFELMNVILKDKKKKQYVVELLTAHGYTTTNVDFCNDGMSDLQYPVHATFHYKNQLLQGCAK